jgi:hypothetical protein
MNQSVDQEVSNNCSVVDNLNSLEKIIDAVYTGDSQQNGEDKDGKPLFLFAMNSSRDDNRENNLFEGNNSDDDEDDDVPYSNNELDELDVSEQDAEAEPSLLPIEENSLNSRSTGNSSMSVGRGKVGGGVPVKTQGEWGQG